MTEEEEENVFFLCVSVSFFRVILPPPKISTVLIPRLSLSLSLLAPSPRRADWMKVERKCGRKKKTTNEQHLLSVVQLFSLPLS